jgi:hypothetical protein
MRPIELENLTARTSVDEVPFPFENRATNAARVLTGRESHRVAVVKARPFICRAHVATLEATGTKPAGRRVGVDHKSVFGS